MVLPVAGSINHAELLEFNLVKSNWDKTLTWDQPRPFYNHKMHLSPDRPSAFMKIWGEEKVQTVGKLLSRVAMAECLARRTPNHKIVGSSPAKKASRLIKTVPCGCG